MCHSQRPEMATGKTKKKFPSLTFLGAPVSTSVAACSRKSDITLASCSFKMQNLALRYHYYVQLFNFFILIFMSKSKKATATLETSGNNCRY